MPAPSLRTKPLAPRVERPAAALRRQHAHPAEADVPVGEQQRIDAAGQRQRAAVLPDALAGQVHRHQRRRAGRIDRRARPAEVEAVRDPVGGDAQRAARVRVDVDRRRGRGSSSAAPSNRSWRCRRRPPSGCPRAARAAARRPPAPPRPLPAAGAAAGPSAPLRAARCRRSAGRSGRSPRRSRPSGSRSCPAATGSGS